MKKEERLFAALSGVSDELLERSERRKTGTLDRLGRGAGGLSGGGAGGPFGHGGEGERSSACAASYRGGHPHLRPERSPR